MEIPKATCISADINRPQSAVRHSKGLPTFLHSYSPLLWVTIGKLVTEVSGQNPFPQETSVTIISSRRGGWSECRKADVRCVLRFSNGCPILSELYGIPNVAVKVSASDGLTFRAIEFGSIGSSGVDTAFSFTSITACNRFGMLSTNFRIDW
jgi:hypothetical protein